MDNGEADLNKITGYKQAQRERQLSDGGVTPDMSGDEKCRFCGKKGHGARPSFAEKKEFCPAFDKKCNSCGNIGHFSRSKACKKAVKVEKLLVQHETPGDKNVEVKSVKMGYP